MKWIVALLLAVLVVWIRRDRRTPEQRLRDAYLGGDKKYLRENLPPPTDDEFNAERWGESFAEMNLDRQEDGLELLDYDSEFEKAWFHAQIEAYRNANRDLPWRSW